MKWAQRKSSPKCCYYQKLLSFEASVYKWAGLYWLGHSHKKGHIARRYQRKQKVTTHIRQNYFYSIQQHQFLTFCWQFKMTSTNISNLTLYTGVKCFCQYHNKRLSSFFLRLVRARIKSNTNALRIFWYNNESFHHFFLENNFALDSMLEGFDFNFAHIIKVFLRCWIAYALYMYLWGDKQNVANTSVCKFCEKWEHSAICMQKCLCFGTDKIEKLLLRYWQVCLGADFWFVTIAFQSRLTCYEYIDFS